jgi:ribosomal protein L10
MVREDKKQWKANYFAKIVQLFDEYPKCFMVRGKEKAALFTDGT